MCARDASLRTAISKSALSAIAGDYSGLLRGTARRRDHGRSARVCDTRLTGQYLELASILRQPCDVLTTPDSPDGSITRRSLLQRIQEVAIEGKCLASTVVTPPFDRYLQVYEEELRFDFRDSRIGQATHLPEASSNLEERLMNVFHSKTRYMVRKAYRSNIEFYVSESEEDLHFHADLYMRHSLAKGIVAKSWEFFSLVPRCFDYGKDYKVFIATRNGKRIAALLVFYYNNTVEYFTLCIVEQHRNLQPMSLLIFEAMKEAVFRGDAYWNWGGTGHGLEGVYRWVQPT